MCTTITYIWALVVTPSLLSTAWQMLEPFLLKWGKSEGKDTMGIGRKIWEAQLEPPTRTPSNQCVPQSLTSEHLWSWTFFAEVRERTQWALVGRYEKSQILVNQTFDCTYLRQYVHSLQMRPGCGFHEPRQFPNMIQNSGLNQHIICSILPIPEWYFFCKVFFKTQDHLLHYRA
jgi:hypothetical protein